MTLNNGVKFPQIGLGTCDAPKDNYVEFIKEAFIEKGYRCLDTASAYGNEDVIGDGL